MDLIKIRNAKEIRKRSLSRKFLVDEDKEFGTNTKFVVQFLVISKGGEIYFQDSSRVMSCCKSLQ